MLNKTDSGHGGSVRFIVSFRKTIPRDVCNPCDNCGLEFAVYGVFVSCPDCQQLNALKTCLASLEAAKKKLVLSRDESFDVDLRREFVQDALGSAIAAFDSYGKALDRHSSTVHTKGKSNLFQDIEALDTRLQEAGVPGVEQLIGESAWEDMKWFFQARHIYSHNAGVVDARFVAKQPSYSHMLGRMLPLDADRAFIGTSRRLVSWPPRSTP